jgi:hypothetical protein
LARTIEPLGRKIAYSEIRWVQRRMLPGKDQPRRQSAFGKRMRDGCQFDGFGPGADDQPNFYAVQASP